MHKFYYFGLNKNNGFPVKGSLFAASKIIAKQRLLHAGILPESVREAPQWLVKINKILSSVDFLMWPISRRRLKEFNFLMASLLKSVFPVADALQLIQIAVNKRLRNIVNLIRYDIISGKSFIEAFLPYERIFSKIFINNLKKIQSGENLANVFQQMSNMEDSLDIVKIVLLPRIPQAFFIVFLVGIALYFGSGYLKSLLDIAQYVDLPVNAMSTSLIHTALNIKRFWYIIILAVIIILFAVKTLVSIPKIKYALDWLWLHMPFLNNFIKAKNRYLFFNILSANLQSGQAVQNAMLSTHASINNLILNKQIYRMGIALQEGKSVGVSLRGVQLLTGVYSQLLKVSAASSTFTEAVEKLKIFSINEFELKLVIFAQILKFFLYTVIVALVAWIGTGALLLYTSILTYLLTPQ